MSVKVEEQEIGPTTDTNSKEPEKDTLVSFSSVSDKLAHGEPYKIMATHSYPVGYDDDDFEPPEKELDEDLYGHKRECSCRIDPAWCELHGGWN